MSGTGWNKGHKYTRWLRINSAQRVTGTDADFTIDMGPSLQKISSLSIVKAQFPNVFYNVFQTTIKYNNYFRLYRSSNTTYYNIRITPGNYSAYTLMAAITTAVSTATSAAVVLVFTLDTATNLVTITCPTLAAGFLTFYTLTDTQAGAINVQGRQDYNPLGLLGFETTSNVTLAALTSANSYTGTNFPSLNNPNIAYLTSRTLAPGNSFDEKGSKSNVIAPIAINAQWLGLVTFDCQQDVLCSISYGLPRSLTNIDIQLVDHDLDPLDLHGNELNIDMRIWTNDIN